MLSSKNILIIFIVVLTAFSMFYFNEEVFEGSTYEEIIDQGMVERVIDGDTAEIRMDEGLKTVRFLGIDTPEVYQENNPEEYRGVTDEDCLILWGEKATNYTKEQIEGEEIQLVYDTKRGRKGFYNRTLAYIEINGRDFTKELIEEGYARVYDKPDFQRKIDYFEAEAEAYSERRGLWNCS